MEKLVGMLGGKGWAELTIKAIHYSLSAKLSTKCHHLFADCLSLNAVRLLDPFRRPELIGQPGAHWPPVMRFHIWEPHQRVVLGMTHVKI